MKALFKTNISIKDFFNQKNHSGLRAEGNISDSAIDNSSQSQFPFSQIEFPDTQEYSQNAQLSCSPSASQTQSPSRKYASLFVNKKQLNSKGSQGASVKAVGYQKHFQTNQTKAKERDERDAVNMVLSSVRECTADIQVAVDAVKEKVQQGISCSESSLSQALHQIQNHLHDHTLCIKQSLEVKSDVIQKISTLESYALVKDSQISSLQEEIKVLKKKKEHHMVDELQKVYLECQENTTDNMQQMYNRHQHELAKHAKLNEKHYIDLSNKTQEFQEQFRQDQTASMRALYDNLLGEINQVLSSMSHDLETDIVKKLQALHQHNSQQIQSTLVKQVHIMSDNHNHADVLKQHERHFKDLQEQQFQQLQGFVGQQIQEIQNMLKETTEKLWQDAMEKNKCQWDEQEKEKVQQDAEKRYDQELKDLKARYQNEVSMLMAEQTKTPCVPEVQVTTGNVVQPKTFRPHLSCFSPTVLIDKSEQMQSSAQPFNDFSTDAPLSKYMPSNGLIGSRNIYQTKMKDFEFPSRSGKPKESSKSLPVTSERDTGVHDKHAVVISPHLCNRNWTSKSLFGKNTCSSPIATVIPLLRKNTMEPAVRETQTQNEPQASNASKLPKKRRRKKAPKYSKKKRKSASQATSSQVPPATQTTHVENQTNSEEDVETTQYVAPQSESIFGEAFPPPPKSDGAFRIDEFHDEESMNIPRKSARRRMKPSIEDRKSFCTQDLFKSTLNSTNNQRIVAQDIITRTHCRDNSTTRQDDSLQDESHSVDSSPSLSIADIVIRRKIKREKSSPTKPNCSVGEFEQSRQGAYSWQFKKAGGVSSRSLPDGPLLLKKPKRPRRNEVKETEL